MEQIRVRFAPSPTGHLHIGSLRVALFNWLFARSYDGVYLVRIEDTDIARSRSEYTKSIISTLQWASLEPDEPVVVQSEHVTSHMEMIDRLIQQGAAYRCWCTRQELESRCQKRAFELTDNRESQQVIQYDGHCRARTEAPPAQAPTQNDESVPFVIRLRIPDDVTEVQFEDLIHGPISTPREQLDDFILVRSDGTPVYNFVVVVDDACMEITHVLRGDDHIANTAKQLLVYRACDLNAPRFGHLPQITAASGRRLSKREGAVGVEEFRREGFLADAMINYLVRLGWSHGDQEIFTRSELVTHFSLSGVNVASAVFDREKLEWVNGVYMRRLEGRELLEHITRDCDPDFPKKFVGWSRERLEAALELYRDRVKTLNALAQVVTMLYAGPEQYPHELIQGLRGSDEFARCREVIDALVTKLNELGDSSHITMMTVLKGLAVKKSVSFREVAQPIRIALTGWTSSPGVAHLIEVVGIDETVVRLKKMEEVMIQDSEGG